MNITKIEIARLLSLAFWHGERVAQSLASDWLCFSSCPPSHWQLTNMAVHIVVLSLLVGSVPPELFTDTPLGLMVDLSLACPLVIF